MMNWKGFGRKQLWLVALSQHLSGGIGENHEKPVRMAGVLGKVQTENFPNMNEECYCYANMFT
jgi:hypothetical protein